MDWSNESGNYMPNSLGVGEQTHLSDTKLYVKGSEVMNDCSGEVTGCSDISSSDICNSFSGCNYGYCQDNFALDCTSFSESDCNYIYSNYGGACTPNYNAFCDGTLDCSAYSNNPSDCNSHSSQCYSNSNGHTYACEGGSGCENYINQFDCNADGSGYGGCSWYFSCDNNGVCSNLGQGDCSNYAYCSWNGNYNSCSTTGSCSQISSQGYCDTSGIGCQWQNYCSGTISSTDCSQVTDLNYCNTGNTNGYCSVNFSTDFRGLVVQVGVSQLNDSIQCLDSAGNKGFYIDNTCNRAYLGQLTLDNLYIYNDSGYIYNEGYSYLYSGVTIGNITPLQNNQIFIGTPLNRFKWLYANNVFLDLLNVTSINTTNIISSRGIFQNLTTLNLSAINVRIDNLTVKSINFTNNFFSTDKSIEFNSTSDTLNIVANINQTIGNASINMIYGEMWNKSDTSFARIDLVTPDVYVPLLNLTSGTNNGITINHGQNMTFRYSGVYKITAKVGVEASSISGEDGMKIFIDGTGYDNCYDHEHTSTTQPIGFILDCVLRVNAWSNLTVRFDDHTNPVSDLNVLNANINVLRIGT